MYYPHKMSKEHFNGFPENNAEPSKELIKLCDEWERQIGKYLRLDFHKVLDLSAEEYLRTIPKFQPPPREFERRFNRLLLIEPRINPSIQLFLAGYEYHVEGKTIDNVKKPKINPYIIWLEENSERNVNHATALDERGATVQEGTALLIAYPEVLNDQPIALTGSSILSFEENGKPQTKIPCIYKWSDGLAGIGADFKGYLEDEGAKPATCIRII